MTEISRECRAELSAAFESEDGNDRVLESNNLRAGELRTLLDYADQRDEAVALLREARLIVGTNIMESSARTPGRAAKARDLTPRIDALLRRIKGD